MSYKRVIPRDFFNESKLLKCLGKLSIAVLDRKLGPIDIEDDLDPDKGFKIEQSVDGEIFCSNYKFIVHKDNNDYSLVFYTPLNSREDFPLYCHGLEVLDGKGNPTKDFKEFLKEL